MDVDSLEGWLLKKKGKDKSSYLSSAFSSDNRRWFKVKEVQV